MPPLSPVQAQVYGVVRQRFLSSAAMTAAQRDYRWRHTLRVAALGREIARAERLSEDALVAGCLLHDLAYAEPILDDAAWLAHGRRSAALARPFVEQLALPQPEREALLYGVAIHVDDKSDFPGQRTALSLSIGDCDNLDRFDVYRIYENLEYARFSAMDAAAQAAFVADKRAHLAARLDEPLATAAATRLWRERIAYQTGFYDRLAAQLAREDGFATTEDSSV